ncbi:MAG: hypothetical protein K6G33_00745 [Ruminococcus sp.]|uniref:hypothetical protein n=1 Tax=Ruminococcus sp. TaxID=41978 RepID=UPI0025D5F651|nr:hypothetical protein [Ruminococcus sp.]MCR5599261.1 hypothetical protein [Ruminococcus sp.]
MKDKDKTNIPDPDSEDKKLDIQKSVFQVNKELRQQQEDKLKKQQEELERQYAEREKKKREEYEKQLQNERIELMRMKQGLIDESETIKEEQPEEIKLSLPKKIGNFFFHNKWWLGIGAFFVFLISFLLYDLLSKPNPDMVILMLCPNESISSSVYLESYFSELGIDSNNNGKVLVSVYYIPYSDDEYQNYTKGVTNKLTTFLNNADGVVIIGDKTTVTDLLVPEESLVDLSKIYPDNPHVKDYYFYLKDTDFAQRLGIPDSEIPDDLYFAIRKPKDLINSSKEDMQATYDKDFPVFNKIVNDLT